MIFGDTETTGLLQPEANELRNQPYITEIYLVKLELNKRNGEFTFIDELETFVRPPIPISEEITKITGITDAMLMDAPSFAQIYPKLCEFFLGETTFVAHNCSFDTGMLWCELARLEKEFKFPWPSDQQCTVELSMPLENKRLSLAKLHEKAFGAPHENAHRAKNDVMAMVRCYSWLVQSGVI